MSRNKTIDRTARRVAAVLTEHYLSARPDAQVDVYRYNSASVRVRVIDPQFADISPVKRDQEIWPLLREHLPDDTLSQISVLLLLAPGELPTSMMNAEFDDPTPSRL